MPRSRYYAIFALLVLGACAPVQKTTVTKRTPTPPPPSATPRLPELPPTPPEAPLQISVVYPLPGQARPAVDSNFIFGSVGNGHANLTINGYPVPLSKNGAFLAFLPMPSNESYQLVARRGSEMDSSSVAYSAIRPASIEKKKTKPAERTWPPIAEIVKGSDTLQTGNDVAPGATTPDGNREWFFPRRTKLRIVEWEGAYCKVELKKNVYAWVADSNFDFSKRSHLTRSSFDLRGIHSPKSFVDFCLPCEFNPFLIKPSGNSIRILIYGKSQPSEFNSATTDPLIKSVGYDSTEGSTEYNVVLDKPIWGYKAFYEENGSLVVRLRRPPTIDKDNPLKGLRIMIDPGHPPGGATGPTGLMEREANLAIATRLRDQLVAKGAIVLMTHSDLHGFVSDVNQVQELDARASLGVAENVDLMVSVHNNAFPDGTNPFLNYGTSTFYFHPFSAPLAASLDQEIAKVTGVPNLGSMQKSLAVCRPTWMPCALTESLHMMFPDQEQALRDPKFLDALAAAHVRGIEDFVRERAQ